MSAQQPPTEKTPFDQLDAQWQKHIITQTNVMLKQETLFEEIGQHSFLAIEETNNKMKSLETNLNVIKETLAMDSKKVIEFNLRVRNQMREAEQRVKASARCGTGSHMPAPTSIPSEFFWNLLNDFESRMQYYKQQIADIESALRTRTHPSSDASVIGEVIAFNNETFLSVVTKVSEVRQRLNHIKQILIRQLGHDPFQKRNDLNTGGEKQRKELMLPPTPISKMQPATPAAGFGASGGLFGSGTTATTGSNMFGSNPTSTGFGNSTGASMFGSSTGSSGGSMFGGSTGSSGGSMFGSSTGSSGASMFGGSTGSSGGFGSSFGNKPVANAFGTPGPTKSGVSFGASTPLNARNLRNSR